MSMVAIQRPPLLIIVVVMHRIQTIPAEADSNTYVLGFMSKFKVVVAGLPCTSSAVLRQ
jgi:hypothetical protein